jgi:hypothetical protein
VHLQHSAALFVILLLLTPTPAFPTIKLTAPSNFNWESILTDDQPQEYFADLISNVSHANGVFRLTFAQQDTGNETRPVVKVMVPANQLQGMMRSIASAANEIREKVQAQIDSQGGDTMGEPAATAKKPKAKAKSKAKTKPK